MPTQFDTTTPLGGIAEIVATAAPEWSVELGFNTDVDAWIRSNTSTGQTILITFDGDVPMRRNEAGIVKAWAMRISLYMRARADVTTFLSDVWPVYRSIRDALNGAVVSDGGKGRQVILGEGSASVANGFAVPTLAIAVQ